MLEEILNKYKVTVGIECHVQLATETKLFSGADNDERGEAPNSVVSPIDYALPGMLPVLNRKAVDLAIIAGKALNCNIAKVSRFDRKHYFYPDLPKGYQISQMYQPIIESGKITVPLLDEEPFEVRINHAHLEEDAGKLTHVSNYSLVDLNRAGTPLIEIVSEPDIHSPAQAKAYAMELYRLMTYAGVTRGDLYHGNMRFDVNVSVALKDSNELGTRSEMKNLNSFRSVERAVDYEFKRQIEILEKGDTVIQETRGWDESKQKTFTQRSKENAQDYRYMPDPDIPPIILSDEEIKEKQSNMPKLPPFYRQEWQDIGLDSSVINSLLLSQESAKTFQRIKEKVDGSESVKRIANWFLLSADDQLYEDGEVQNNTKSIPDEYFIDLSKMVDDNKLSSTAAKEVFFDMLKTSDKPDVVAEKLNLLQVSDEQELLDLVDEVILDPALSQAVQDLQNGSEKVMGFLVGQVMKKSGGKANPSKTQDLIRRRVLKSDETTN